MNVDNDIARLLHTEFDLLGLRFVEMEQHVLSHQLEGLGERWKLLQWGTGPDRSELLVHFIVQETCINVLHITSILQKSPTVQYFRSPGRGSSQFVSITCTFFEYVDKNDIGILKVCYKQSPDNFCKK